jgi:transcriptional regulator with XRE-family HTH domain
MARRARRVRDANLADALRTALANGAFAPADASRAIRALEGLSRDAFAARLGISAKVIKALESGGGNPRYDSLAKIADAAGLRVAFVKASGVVELLDPDARAADKRRRRLADSEALQAGKVSARVLHERNALAVDEIAFELPRLP